MGRLQYIASTNGSFNSVLAQNVTQDSIIEVKFLSYDYSSMVYFGDINADVVVRHWYGTDDMYWHNGGVFQIESYWTLNEEHTVSFSTSEYKFDEHTFSVTGTCNIPSTPKYNPTVNGRLYYFKITDNSVDRVNLVAWDENGVLGMKDLVSGNFYTPSSGTWTAGPHYVPPTPNNQVPINKYKLGADNIQKTYEGGMKINKMYVGSNLVYMALPTTTPAPTPTLVDYVHTSTPTLTANYINTSVYPTVNTTFRIVYKPNAPIDAALVGFDTSYNGNGRTPTGASSDSTDYRYFYHRGLDDVTFDFNSSRFYKIITFDSDGYADVTIGNNYITDNIAQSTVTGGTQSTITPNIPIYLNVSSDLDFRSLEIWQNNVKVYDGHAAVFNGEYGVYDSVGGTFTTQTYGGNTMSGGNI